MAFRDAIGYGRNVCKFPVPKYERKMKNLGIYE